MNRKQLEALVWKDTHADFKGKGEDGSRRVLHLVEGLGTCSVLLSSLSNGELVHKLSGRERQKHGLVFWRLVVGSGDIVLGVFGSALYEDQQACRAQVVRKLGIVPRLVFWAGKRPAVGDVLHEASETIETAATLDGEAGL